MTSKNQAPQSGTTRPRVAAATAAVATAGGRSNLFRSQLTRMPTAGSSNSSENTVRLDVEVLSDTSDIVVRNQQGEIELGDPPTPEMEEGDEQVEDKHETEKERQRLAEALKRHSENTHAPPDQQEELLEAVRASLRDKVTALADDNWMFEPEDQLR
ncbi:hypothetical protein E4U19_001366 [Claviceps sp. Clav32 group G5]|nr:hypothetical protein E4U40_003953 [Claviceps sp. LM458 group G5]KAG6028673.1 hypothetical protein E4U19_001366 [Claviceps sp. Clav32 group G5]KAG6046100.1 hypothetical protein E4U39_001655 [Claviceps sp. Clav50 group G5]